MLIDHFHLEAIPLRDNPDLVQGLVNAGLKKELRLWKANVTIPYLALLAREVRGESPIFSLISRRSWPAAKLGRSNLPLPDCIEEGMPVVFHLL